MITLMKLSKETWLSILQKLYHYILSNGKITEVAEKNFIMTICKWCEHIIY